MTFFYVLNRGLIKPSGPTSGSPNSDTCESPINPLARAGNLGDRFQTVLRGVVMVLPHSVADKKGNHCL